MTWLRRGAALAQVSGFRVTYVRNITDIDDKIIKRAVERGIPIRQLTDEMTVAMHQDFDASASSARRTSRAPPTTSAQMMR